MTTGKFAAMRKEAISQVDVLETHEEKLKGVEYDTRLQLGAIQRLVSTNQQICEDGFEALNKKLDRLLRLHGEQP